MSIKFHIAGIRTIYIPKVIKLEKQTVYFDCRDTSTEITQDIIKAKNPIKAYKDWVKKYDNYHKEHLIGLKAFIKEHIKRGFEIKVEAW